LSFAKIRAASRVATPDNEERLLDLARHGTASHVEKVVRAWRRVDRLAEQTEERERHRSRALTLYFDDDGMAILRGRLDPEVGAVLERALAAAGEALYGRGGAADAAKAAAAAGMEPATIEQRRADAIGLIAECALRSGLVMDAQATPCRRRGDSTPERRPPVAARPDQRAPAQPDRPTLTNRNPGIGSTDACSVSCAADVVSEDTGTPGHAWDAMSRASDAVSGDSGAVGRKPGRVSRAHATTSRADRFQVVEHVDAVALREAADAGQAVLADTRISAETSRRLACDSSRVIMTHDADGTVLDVGRRSRTVPSAIRRALEQRDGGCRFPGCGLRYCDVHHIRHWADGGATRLDNCIFVCRRHHRALHEEGFRVVFEEDGEVRFYRADGQQIPDAPAVPRLPSDPGAALAGAHCGAGLEIDASTTASSWAGECLDIDFAVLTMRGP
jgi:hypothetical protein